MNKPQRFALRLIGFMLFAFALIFIIYSMPHAQDVRMADSICNAQLDIMGLNMQVGQFAQNVLDYRGDCNRIHLLRLGVDYSWVILVVGAILFFIGVWTGLGVKEKKEILEMKKEKIPYKASIITIILIIISFSMIFLAWGLGSITQSLPWDALIILFIFLTILSWRLDKIYKK
jgi:hypothetical protein